MKKNVLCFLVIVFLFACNKEKEATPYQPSVYVVGIELFGTPAIAKAVQWKNGQKTQLSSAPSTAWSCWVEGQDVYVAGVDMDMPCYWKNGNKVALAVPAGTISGSGWDIVVANGSVYVSGVVFAGIAAKAVYWKDGVLTTLTDGLFDATARGIYVNGPDVYVVGSEDNSNYILIAKYWKNGVATNISNGTYPAQAFSITGSGTDIYITYSEGNSGNKLVAKIWKNNGLYFTLSSGVNHAYAKSISISGSDIYACGHEFNGINYEARFWKNGSATPLTNGIYGNGLALYNSDTYVCGLLQETKNIAAYWKNGVLTQLGDGTTNTEANDIVVK